MPVELQIAFNVIGTTTVVVGFVYATIQFRAFLAARRQETALTLMRTTSPPDVFSRSSGASSSSPTTRRPKRSMRWDPSWNRRSSRPEALGRRG